MEMRTEFVSVVASLFFFVVSISAGDTFHARQLLDDNLFTYKMRRRISIRGSVRRSVRPSVTFFFIDGRKKRF